MKFTIALIALYAIAMASGQAPINLSEDQKVRALQHTVACMEQEKSTTAGARALVTGNFDGIEKSTKCFANCFLERAGFLVNGEVQSSVILTKLTPTLGAEKLNTIMGQCNALKGSDNCETAFVLYECYYKQNASIF